MLVVPQVHVATRRRWVVDHRVVLRLGSSSGDMVLVVLVRMVA